MMPSREEELAMMTDSEQWPQWPLLPVKIPGSWSDSSFGLMAEIGGKISPVVYIANLFAPKFDNPIKFNSFEELLDAGWVVD